METQELHRGRLIDHIQLGGQYGTDHSLHSNGL